VNELVLANVDVVLAAAPSGPGLPFSLERPWWGLLLLLIIPIALSARHSVRSVGKGRAIVATVFRSIVVLLLAMALSQPAWVRRGEGLTLMMILDVSESVPMQLRNDALRYLRTVTESKERPEDRIGVILVGRTPEIAALPDEYGTVVEGDLGVDRTATNLAAALDLAMAILPQDTANRVLLVSDGNETVGSAMDSADLYRANRIPIDILPLRYEHEREIIFESMRLPARARVGQSTDLRMFIRSQTEASGTLQLFRNDAPLDLDPDRPGAGLRVTLQPGPNAITVPMTFPDPGTHRFRAEFTPDDPADDAISANNVGAAITFVGGEGRVLVIHGSPSESAALVEALRQSNIVVDTIMPDALVGGLAELNGYDAVVLANVPRWSLGLEADATLHAYVHDLGGGLIMAGGPESFGAGGWIDTDVAKALPVDLDPPQTRQMPRGALALVMHSCEMPQGNYWGQQVAIAAIEALSSLDYVGILTFNWGGGGLAGVNWEHPMQLAGDKRAAIDSARRMRVGDMPDFAPSLQVALQGMLPLSVGQRHVIIISDGDPQPPTQALLDQFVANQITITTVMVGGHGTQTDMQNMNAVATITGGRFYNVTNPRALPQIFVKEAQMVARSLIIEGDDLRPSITSRLPGPLSGLSSVPALNGYVLTARREGLAQTLLVHSSTEGDDPLLAYWNYGLGRSVAWTSDLSGRWARGWVTWPNFRSTWGELTRWAMRPPTPRNVVMRTRTEGDRAIVELDAVDEGAGFVNFLRTEARVLRPDNSAQPLSLQQVGPGRYRGEFDLTDSGAYLVNAVFSGTADGQQLSGSVQAAVSVPYPREYRAVRDNLALMRAIAERTGGRERQMIDPRVVGYFDRSGLEVPRSPKRMWDLLAIIAAAVFVIDVAVRRLAVDPDEVLGAARKLAKPAEKAGEQSVEAWRKARSSAAARGTRAATESAPDPANASRRFEADEAEREGGFSVSDDIAQDPTRAGSGKPAMGKPDAAKPEAPPADGEGEGMSRLLRAKRRALGDDAAKDEPGGERRDG